MKTGVIDVGGGLREIYAVGVFDYCMDHDIHFDSGIGIAATSANLASFAARQRGRNYQFYKKYSFRKQYIPVKKPFNWVSIVLLTSSLNQKVN